MKSITILGATGSIGMQTIDVVRMHPELFHIEAIGLGKNIKVLREILNEFTIPYVCVANEADKKQLEKDYPQTTFYYGEEGLVKIATLENVQIVVNALVGFLGFKPTIEAIKAHKDIALANKETLVAGGEIIMPLVKKEGVQLLPVDSEHSAIFQSLQGAHHQEIKRILLTCSGGSFRDFTYEQLKDVTVKQALNHPNWSMGAKITIDSATLFNKGLEVIEAKWLFDVDYDQIKVYIHPESVIHSMVEYVDRAVIAQLGTPDMRLPIQYALTYPNREVMQTESLDLAKIASLNFKEVDNRCFPALQLAYQAGKIGKTMPCVMNGANEIANEAFRNGLISFLDIYKIVEDTMKHHEISDELTIETIKQSDAWAREYATRKVREINADNH